MTNNILIITSSGGGGLLQSAIAIEQEETKKDPNVKIIKKDLLMEWVGSFFGKLARSFYNWTQRSGNVLMTNILVDLNMYAEVVFYPSVFFCTLYNLFKHSITRVIDNQPMNASAILKAIRFYNWYAKKNIVFEKVLVDLPTREYRQMMKAIKKISKADKKHMQIFTIEPLLDDEKSNEEFWQKNCKISEKQIIYKKYIIRQNFKKYQGKEKNDKDFDINVYFSSKEESSFIEKCFEKGNVIFRNNADSFTFEIKSKDIVFTVLLGSQPSSNAVYKYIKGFIEKIREENSPDKNYRLFVFSDVFSAQKKTLFNDIFELIDSCDNYPTNLSVIPMSFQNDEVISALFYRSDLTITRSGGHSIMELMAVSHGTKWIHSDAKKGRGIESLTYEKLLTGIPCWEKGNARYLHDKFDGDVVTPEIIYSKLSEVF